MNEINLFLETTTKLKTKQNKIDQKGNLMKPTNSFTDKFQQYLILNGYFTLIFF